MIVVDLETSGSDYIDHGIWQIGAVDTENEKNIFLEDARIDDDDLISEEAMKITGMDEKKLRNKKKQSQKELIKRFFDWCSKIKNKNFAAHNPSFDISFLRIKAKKYGLEDPFQTRWRYIDTHTIACLKYVQIYGKFPEEDGYSVMSLNKIVDFCGLKAERKIHDGLEDAKLEAECLIRMMYGRALLSEYKKFPVPEHLKYPKK